MIMTSPLPDRWLDVEELCELTSLKPKSVYDLTYRRQIPYTKVGQRLRFRLSKIERWLEDRSVDPE
jgi:excisionase family DNA binding protein